MLDINTSDNRILCMFCGCHYRTSSKDMFDHLVQCQTHPMRKIAESLCLVMTLSFPPTKQEVDDMDRGIRMCTTAENAEDAKAALDALTALRIFVRS